MLSTLPPPVDPFCPFRVDKDIPAGPGPWICDKPAGHEPAHHLVQEPKGTVTDG